MASGEKKSPTGKRREPQKKKKETSLISLGLAPEKTSSSHYGKLHSEDGGWPQTEGTWGPRDKRGARDRVRGSYEGDEVLKLLSCSGCNGNRKYTPLSVEDGGLRTDKSSSPG